MKQQQPKQQPSQMAAEFVAMLDIEIAGSGRIWRAQSPTALKDDRQPQIACAYVVAASVVAFADGILGQQREDLLNSTLLAQLSANRHHDRERDTLNWYAYYRSVLVKLGWRIDRVHARRSAAERAFVPRAFFPLQGTGMKRPTAANQLTALPFVPVMVRQPRFTADATVLALLHGKVQPAAFDVTAMALEKLSGLAERDRRSVIFESSSHSAERGSFQIIAVSAAPGQMIRMTIAAFFFVAGEHVTRVLSFNFGKSTTNMYQACDAMTLDSSAYDAVRNAVIEQLSDQAAAYIDELELS